VITSAYWSSTNCPPVTTSDHHRGDAFVVSFFFGGVSEYGKIEDGPLADLALSWPVRGPE